MALGFRRLHAFLRGLTESFFFHFGIHCAQYQIRVILISCVVITSLFYPALSIYFTSKPLSTFSTRLLDSLLGSATGAPIYRSDIRDIWDGYPALRMRDNAVVQARCGVERTIRLERILVPSISPNVYAVLNPETLASGLKLANLISSTLHSGEYKDSPLQCISAEKGDCIVLTPLLFWDNDESKVSSDTHFINTIYSDLNVTSSMVPLHADMVLAGIDLGHGYMESEFLVMTYYFEEDDCHSNTKHNAWVQALSEATNGYAHITPSYSPSGPKLIALEYDAEGTQRKRFSWTSVLLYLVYIIVFVHFSGSLRSMNWVHSRFGLAFTGLVEILASTITSVSVCALWGFQVTMVPWGILPVVIVFVGAENMFRLIEAVGTTSVSLSVKERIGLAVKQAGTSNTFRIVFCNAVLGVISVFATGAIRQFCAFAIVVLVAHWFLVHTFFVAVLSIDIQRLELHDLLRQGTTMKPSPTDTRKVNDTKSPTRKAWSSLRYTLRSKTMTNGSLILMLIITGALYYATYPFENRSNDDRLTRHVPTAPSTSRFTDPAMPQPSQIPTTPPISSLDSPALRIWNTLNPENEPRVHIRIEPPSLVVPNPAILNKNDTIHSPDRLDNKERNGNKPKGIFGLKSLRPILWVFKILVLPIGLTTSLLYGLLLYLLKDAELKEAQRNKEGGGSRPITATTTPRPVDPNFEFEAFARALETDVELIAGSKDGNVLVGVSIENEVTVWERKTVHIVEGVGEELNGAVITCLAVSWDGAYIAVGTDAGNILVWSLEHGRVLLKSRFGATTTIDLPPSAAPVYGLAFDDSCDLTTPGATTFSLVSAYEDGNVILWERLSAQMPRPLLTTRPRLHVKPSLLSELQLRPRSGNSSIQVAIPMEDGCVDLFSFKDGRWSSTHILQAGTPDDLVSDVVAKTVQVGDTTRTIVLVSTQSAHISVWDGKEGIHLASLDDISSPVDRMRISPVQTQQICSQCGELPADGFTVVISNDKTINVYNASIPLQPKRCACPKSQIIAPTPPSRMRSRNGSLTSSAVTSTSGSPTTRPRLKLAPSNGHLQTASTTTSNGDYQLSSHGIHSRRLSSMSTDSDTLGGEPAPLLLTQRDAFPIPLPHHHLGLSSDVASWPHLKVVLVAMIPYDRGAWDVSGSLVVGVRRRLRTVADPHATNGEQSQNNPPSHHLDRWELFTVNPYNSKSEGMVRSSPLSSIMTLSESSSASNRPNKVQRPNNLFVNRRDGARRIKEGALPSVPFTFNAKLRSDPVSPPRLPFTRISPLVVTGPICSFGMGNTVGFITLPPNGGTKSFNTLRGPFTHKSTDSFNSCSPVDIAKKRL